MSFFADQLIVRVVWDLYRNLEHGKAIEDLHRSRLQSEREHEIRMARTRWLERNRSHASFPCGIAAIDRDPPAPTGSVPAPRRAFASRSAAEGSEPGGWIPPRPDVWGSNPTRTVPVTVAVTDDAFVFLREGVAEIDDERVLEVWAASPAPRSRRPTSRMPKVGVWRPHSRKPSNPRLRAVSS